MRKTIISNRLSDSANCTNHSVLIFKSDVYGGDIATETCASGDAYFEKLGSLIASDDSPDLVTKDAFMF